MFWPKLWVDALGQVFWANTLGKTLWANTLGKTLWAAISKKIRGGLFSLP